MTKKQHQGTPKTHKNTRKQSQHSKWPQTFKEWHKNMPQRYKALISHSKTATELTMHRDSSFLQRDQNRCISVIIDVLFQSEKLVLLTGSRGQLTDPPGVHFCSVKAASRKRLSWCLLCKCMKLVRFPCNCCVILGERCIWIPAALCIALIGPTCRLFAAGATTSFRLCVFDDVSTQTPTSHFRALPLFRRHPD